MFETVHAILNFYDCPRTGIADLSGVPHLFQVEWDAKQDDYADTYLLSPIDAETQALALEDWAIWRRWENAFHHGLAGVDSHPALPHDRERHEELTRLLANRLQLDPARTVRKRGEFRARPVPADRPHGPRRDWEVRWKGPV